MASRCNYFYKNHFQSIFSLHVLENSELWTFQPLKIYDLFYFVPIALVDTTTMLQIQGSVSMWKRVMKMVYILAVWHRQQTCGP